jgi:hypothetical protein
MFNFFLPFFSFSCYSSNNSSSNRSFFFFFSFFIILIFFQLLTFSFVFSCKLCSIIGIYISIISVTTSFIRSQLFCASKSIVLDELPQVNALWHFLNDIYLLRTVHEYTIENDFFDRLIYIYRSPEVFIYWTKEI